MFAELLEHPEDGTDLADTFIVAAERGKPDLDVCACVFGGQINAEAVDGGGRQGDDRTGGLVLTDGDPGSFGKGSTLRRAVRSSAT
ncbi:hypothetical protein [Mycobacteroides chelonae]|uniref:hypothetical protein n=1 Tax=Mycobacteroides chelonae TaxID=1774 RepID=UPI001F454EB5|nr:hypothetical protein [Mycobacteroides chelonae]